MKMTIDGDIVQWNESIYTFKKQLQTADENEELEVEINSNGGDAFLGIDIANRIRSHKGKTKITITGIAASAASVIAFAFDEIRMFGSSQIMIHNAWTNASGDANKFRKVAEMLDSMKESMISAYSTKIDGALASELMDEEKFLTAQKCIELNIATSIVEGAAKEVKSELFSKQADEFNATIAKEKEEAKENLLVASQINAIRNSLLKEEIFNSL